MQLRNARLCLDCEEVHDAPQCPSCASETFAYISRWVPTPEHRTPPPTRPEPPSPETLDSYRQLLEPQTSTRWKLARSGAVGLALFGVAGWMWRRNARQEDHQKPIAPEE